MRQVVPSVYATKDKDYEKRFDDACKLARRVHVDVMDGHFVSSKSPSLSALHTSPQNEIDVHLMVRKPEKYIEDIKRIGARRVYLHVEIDKASNIIELIGKFKAQGLSVHAVINPDTHADEIIPLAVHIDGCLIMSVRPGREGQQFINGTFSKIREVARVLQGKEISVDGGITREIAMQLRDTPVSVIVAGSSVFRSGNAEKAISSLREAFN